MRSAERVAEPAVLGAPQRTTPPLEADERITLTAFLDFQRATLALKCT